jgi:hypothetical protein
MSTFQASGELRQWAERGGWSFTNTQGVDEGIFYTPGGESRYYIRPDSEGWLTVTSRERGGDEWFEFSAPGSAIVEKLFWGIFGLSVRSSEQVNPGYVLVPRDPAKIFSLFKIGGPDAQGLLVLIGPQGDSLVRVQNYPSDREQLVKFSYYLSASRGEIEESFLSSDGKPLFSVP